MEVFIRVNCFSLLSFLYLIVTSDLPPGAHGTSRSKTVLLDSASSTMNDKHFYNIGLPLSSHKNAFPPLSSSPSSFHSPSMATSTSSTSNGKQSLPTTNNANNNILLILSSINTNKRSSSPTPFKTSYEDEGDVSRDMIIAPVSGRGRNNRHHRNEETTTTIGWSGKGSRRIATNNKLTLTVPRAEEGSSRSRDFSQSLSYSADGVNPLPVAYLMNSLYELEPPPLLSNPLDGGELGGEGSSISSSSRARQTVRGSASDDWIMLLQNNNNNNGDINEPDSNNRDNREIPSVLTTPFPLLSAAVVADPLSTSFPLLESIQQTTLSSTSLNDDDGSAGVEDGSENVPTTEDPASVTQGTTALRGKCNETSQCFGEHVECRVGICKCQLGFLPRIDNGDLCGEASAHHVEVPTTDPTMIGVVVGLALMSVTLCIVLRLFAKARFRENRTIFNTPNPRLMNVSLLKGSKTLLRGNSAGQRSRRGSQASVASGQGDGQSISATPDGNGTSVTAGSSHHPHRVKPSRTLSTDTNNLEGTPTSTRPLPAVNRSKFRQDSVASNV